MALLTANGQNIRGRIINAEAVTTHDTSANVYDALYVGTGGDLAVKPAFGNAVVVFANIPDGALIPMATALITTATTCSDIVGLVVSKE